jgi:hypothetical protein
MSNQSQSGRPPRSQQSADSAGVVLATLLLGCIALALVALEPKLQDFWWVLCIVLLLAVLIELFVARMSASRAATASRSSSLEPPRSGQTVAEAPPNSSTSAWASAPAPPSAGPPVLIPASPSQGRPPDSADARLAQELPAQPASFAPVPSFVPTAQAVRSGVPQLIADALWTPKSSHATDEHEDAWAIGLEHGRAAIADGASSAFMSREWAAVLTRSYVDSPPSHDLAAVRRWVAASSQDWSLAAHGSDSSAQADHDGATRKLSDVRAEIDQVQNKDWWSAESERRGSFAAFVGIKVGLDEASGEVCWDALAVGDSCLIQVRPHGSAIVLECAFPIDSADAFGGNPELVATAGAEGAGLLPVIRTASGNLRQGDVLLLMTDALAQWAITQDSLGQAPWTLLLGLTQPEIGPLAIQERATGAMVDDDVSLVRVALA